MVDFVFSFLHVRMMTAGTFGRRLDNFNFICRCIPLMRIGCIVLICCGCVGTIIQLIVDHCHFVDEELIYHCFYCYHVDIMGFISDEFRESFSWDPNFVVFIFFLKIIFTFRFFGDVCCTGESLVIQPLPWRSKTVSVFSGRILHCSEFFCEKQSENR